MPYTGGKTELKRAYRGVPVLRRKIVEAAPDATEAELEYSTRCYKEGLAKALESKYSEALVKLNRAIKLDPKNIYAYCTKAFILYEQKWYEESMDLCKKALKINRFIPEIWVILGNNYKTLASREEKKGRLDKAVKFYRLALLSYQFCNQLFGSLLKLFNNTNKRE